MNYSNAIVRLPASSSVKGLTSVNIDSADFDLLNRQHKNYVFVLKDLGLNVIELEPLEPYPDAYFVEDVAIVTPEIAVIMRPGADSRRGETPYIESSLKDFRELAFIEQPGTIDGGDVLIVEKHVVVGLSERTNREGADQLGNILGQFGYHYDAIDVSEALHLKSSVNFVDANTLLVTQACSEFDCFASYQKIIVPQEEAYAANVVLINGKVLIPAGYRETAELLKENGYETIALPVSEVAKMDGGLTCLSLRLT